MNNFSLLCGPLSLLIRYSLVAGMLSKLNIVIVAGAWYYIWENGTGENKKGSSTS